MEFSNIVVGYETTVFRERNVLVIRPLPIENRNSETSRNIVKLKRLASYEIVSR